MNRVEELIERRTVAGFGEKEFIDKELEHYQRVSIPHDVSVLHVGKVNVLLKELECLSNMSLDILLYMIQKERIRRRNK